MTKLLIPTFFGIKFLNNIFSQFHWKDSSAIFNHIISHGRFLSPETGRILMGLYGTFRSCHWSTAFFTLAPKNALNFNWNFSCGLKLAKTENQWGKELRARQAFQQCANIYLHFSPLIYPCARWSKCFLVKTAIIAKTEYCHLRWSRAPLPFPLRGRILRCPADAQSNLGNNSSQWDQKREFPRQERRIRQ